MDNPETRKLIFDSMNDIKQTLVKVGDKLDNLSVDMATIKEKQISANSKIDHVEDRLDLVERLATTLKERQNLIYGVAGVVSALVTFIIAGFKSFLEFINGGV